VVWLGDSITAAVGYKSIADLTNFLLHGNMVPVVGYNQGVSGNQTSDMITRQATGLNLNPEIYFILAGTNDIVIGGASAATIISRLQTIINNALATPSVKLVVIRTILKRASPNAFSAPQRVVCDTVNAWIMSLKIPKVLTINYDASSFDATNGVHTSDGLHPNEAGAFLLAEYTANQVRPYIQHIDVAANRDGNLYTNDVLAGENGSYTGISTPPRKIATGLNIRNYTGLTVTADKSVHSGSYNNQILTLNGVTTAGYIEIINTISYSGTAGQSYELIFPVTVTNGAGLGGIRMLCDGTITFGATSTAGAFINKDVSGVIRSGRSTLAGSDVSNTCQLAFYFPAGVTVSGMVIKIGRPIWRLV
jgi:lysophospholipase L1-like esterase